MIQNNNILKIESTVRILIATIFVVFPLWEVISAQLNYFLHIPIGFLGLLKYSILIATIYILIYLHAASKKLFSLSIQSLMSGLYVVYIVLHVISDVDVVLILDGLKYELLYPLLAFLLLVNIKKNVLPKIDLILKIILVQGMVILFIGLYEYFNQDILAILYRSSLELIPHISWFSIKRLISIVGNPINLGAMTTIFVIVLNYFYNENKTSMLKPALPILIILSFFVVIMTLSRTSLMVFILIITIILSISVKGLVNRSIFYLSLISLILVLYYLLYEYIDLELVFKRFSGLADNNEYTDNTRTLNWKYAISSMDYLQYIWGKGIGISTPNADLAEKYGGLIVENGFISTFIEYGLIGISLYTLFFLRFMYIAFELRASNGNLAYFFILFLIVFSLFNLGNDYNRNIPFNLYFWTFYAYLEFIKLRTHSGYGIP